MQVTLSNGKRYRLSFAHEYIFLFQTTGREYIYNEKDKVIGLVETKKVATKVPVTTHAYLNEINPETGSRISLVPDYMGRSDLNPIDMPNKEIARRIALTRLIKTVDDTNDRHLIDLCYRNRKGIRSTNKVSF